MSAQSRPILPQVWALTTVSAGGGPSHFSSFTDWASGNPLALTEVDRSLLARCLEHHPGAWRDFVDRFIGLFVHVVNHTASSRNVHITSQDIEDYCSDVFQALIKDWWSQIGVETELRNVDSSVFFGGDAGSPDTFQKFYADVEMYANNFEGNNPEPYLAQWTCDKAPRPETQWQGENHARFCDPEYDKLVAELGKTVDLTERGNLGKKMNDMLTKDSNVIIPLVYRGTASAVSNTLEGVKLNAWDTEIWNVADWSRKKQ